MGVVFSKTRTVSEPTPVAAARERAPIYVEVSPLLGLNLAGIGRFVARLVEALARLRPLRLFNTIEGELAQQMRLSNALPCGLEIEVIGTELSRADMDLRRWVRQLVRGQRLRHDVRQARNSAAVFTMLRPGQRHFRRELGILYDFTPLLMPAAHVSETRELFGDLFARRLSLCDKLLAISHSTKADAGWLCNVAADNIEVCYPGPSLCVREHASLEPVDKRDDVVLVVSTFEPRKNGPFLLRWFLNTRVLHPRTELWWVGPDGWLLHQLAKRRQLSARGRIVKLLGMVSDSRLCELYRQARFTIYPSLYEGFGLPVLDSLRHGTPVVSSFNSSLQEFAGPGVFYFDPCDPVTLDSACREVLARLPGPIKRKDLDERFSWDVLARQLVGLCA